MEATAAAGLIALIQSIHRRGWAPGTGGNFSQLRSRSPFRLLITASGVDKGTVGEQQLLEVDEHGKPLDPGLKPSAETLLHLAVLHHTDAQVVLHTHSIWNTLASLAPQTSGGRSPRRFELTGLEMLKGLRDLGAAFGPRWMRYPWGECPLGSRALTVAKPRVMESSRRSVVAMRPSSCCAACSARPPPAGR